MRTERLDEAADHLSELADEVESTQGHLRLTRRGRASLVLLTEDEFASMQETIALAADPAAQRELAAADEAYAAGDYVTGAQLVGLPDTGAPIWPLALGGVLLVAAGAVPTAVRLRRG